jgi:hypothetical protein
MTTLHQARMDSKSPLAVTQTIPTSVLKLVSLRGRDGSTLALSPSCAGAEEGKSPGVLKVCFVLWSRVDDAASDPDCKKVMNTLAKPDGLYLGRQRGSQDADADEFIMDGE